MGGGSVAPAFRLDAEMHAMFDSVSDDTVCDAIFSLWRNIFLNFTELFPFE